MLPFVGVDGEGGDITDPHSRFTNHQYTMLRAGDQYVTADPAAAAGQPWLEFLARLPKKRIHVAYFFDYDVTMIMRELPAHLLAPLVNGQQIYYGDYRIKYRPRKELEIKHWNTVTTINDVGTFFQCKFVTALKRWNIGTPEELDMIGAGKEDRSTFGELNQRVIDYNLLETVKLEELMSKFRRVCNTIGYMPTRWQGPGQLAKAMFKAHGIPMTKDLPEPPPGVWEMAQAAYYGGRFETSAVGPVNGPVEGWDINSAYPFAATHLPCLLHGRWVPTRSLHPMAMYRVSFTHARKSTWYGLPVRMPDGSIRYPRTGNGWYWGMELESARLLGAQLTIHNGWQHVTDCTCRWFDFNHRLYSIRKAIGKSEAGLALKLGMNSEYGVCAQSVGAAPYANPIWAGLFTAITRARLNEAIALDPYNVYMVATDGLFTRPGYPLTPTDELGGWERTTYPDGMHIVQPGVYFVGHKDTCTPEVDCDCHPKTRGVPLTAINREQDALRDAWHGKPTDGLPIQLRQFIGLRLAVARNALHIVGEWMPVTKRISYDWSTKRRPSATRRGVTATRTLPYDGSTDEWTTPYDRMIGGNLARNMERLEFADQPDWAETLSEVL